MIFPRPSIQTHLILFLAVSIATSPCTALRCSAGRPDLAFLQQRFLQKNERNTNNLPQVKVQTTGSQYSALPRSFSLVQKENDGRSSGYVLAMMKSSLSTCTKKYHQPFIMQRQRQRSAMKKGTKPSSLFLGASNNDNDDSESSSSKSIARAGGRSSGRTPESSTSSDGATSESSSGIVDFAKKAIPLLILLSLLKGLFGFLFGRGAGSDQSYVYYQSTVYESRTYNADGEMERIRKESVKSNVPSMINGNKQEGDVKSLYLQQSDEQFDRELDRIIQRSINTW